MKGTRILLVEDDSDFGKSFALILKRKGYRVTLATSAPQAIANLKDETYDIIISDVVMPDMSGLEFLHALIAKDIEVPVIMLTGYGSVREAVEAMKAGAYSYFLKPVNQDEICLTIEKALEHAHLREENLRLREEIHQIKGAVFPSGNKAMKKLIGEAQALAKSDVSVLITGESGTGKEVLARFIHDKSKRRDNPFIPINCQAYMDTLIESELFGYKANAFTGASPRGKPGKLELAEGGTLFLDEIGELHPAVQIKLLRAIETREIEPVGSVKPVPVNFRLISATNRNLKSEIAAHSFREDLYYRINTITLHIPALRERPEDIIPLARYFLEFFAIEQKKPSLRLTAAAERALVGYSWPGNVRELKNCIEGAVALVRGQRVDMAELRLGNYDGGASVYGAVYSEARQRFEREFFRHYYEQCDGNISAMSRLVRLDRKHLYNKLTTYGIIDKGGTVAD